MLSIRKYLILLLFIGIIHQQSEGSQPDSIKIIVVDFNYQHINKSFKNRLHEIPALLESEIAQHEKFRTLRRDSKNSTEKTFQYDFDALSIDTLILTKLHEYRQIDVIILGKVVQVSDTIFVKTKSLELNDFSILDSSFITLSTDSIKTQLNKQLFGLASTISKNILQSIADQATEEKFTIIFTAFPVIESDSFLTHQSASFIQQIIDSLSSKEFKDIECRFMNSREFADIFSDTVLNNTDSLASIIGKKERSDVIISWRNFKVNNEQFSFQPVIEIIDSTNINKDNDSQQNLLNSALGQIKHVILPHQQSFNIYPVLNFLNGFISAKKNRFADAIKFFKAIEVDTTISKENYFFINFYLADAYLKRGKIHQTTISLAKTDWDTASNYYHNCLNDSDSIENKQTIVWVFNNLGIVNQLQGDLEKALAYFEMALNKQKKLEVDDSIIRIYTNLGNLYLFKGEWGHALDVYRTSIVTMEKLGDKESLAITYDNMGNIYQLIMQRLNAITYYQKSLSLRKELGDELGMAISYGNLGEVHLENKDYPQAFSYYVEELKVNEQLRNEPRIARSYANIGKVYQQEGKIDSATIYFQRSLKLTEIIDDERDMITALNNLANIYYKQADMKKAIEYYDKSLALAEKREDEFTLAKIYDHIADIYNRQQQWDEALEFYEKSAELHERLNYYESLALILFNMGLINLKQNRYREGYQLMKRGLEIDDQYGFFNLSHEKEFIQNLETIIEGGNN